MTLECAPDSTSTKSSHLNSLWKESRPSSSLAHAPTPSWVVEYHFIFFRPKCLIRHLLKFLKALVEYVIDTSTIRHVSSTGYFTCFITLHFQFQFSLLSDPTIKKLTDSKSCWTYTALFFLLTVHQIIGSRKTLSWMTRQYKRCFYCERQCIVGNSNELEAVIAHVCYSLIAL